MTDFYRQDFPTFENGECKLPKCHAKFWCRFQLRQFHHYRFPRPRCKWKEPCNQQRNHPWLTFKEWVLPHLTEEVLIHDKVERLLW